MALSWDFARQIDPAATPGSTISYFDETCQAIYIDSGNIRTQIGNVIKGQWQDVDYDPEVIISDSGYGALDIEHNFSGVVWGTAQHGTDIVMLMYEYMIDITAWLEDGSWKLQPDNPIKQGSISVINADNDRFDDNVYSIFLPGSRVILNFFSGDSDPFPLGLFFIENSPFSVGAKNIKLDGRNRIGFQLATQSVDEYSEMSGSRTEIIEGLLITAAVPESAFLVYEDSTSETYEVDPAKTFLATIEELLSIWDWYIDDLPDGTIVIGPATFIKENVASTGIYTFSRGADLKSRSTRRQASGVYSRIAVKRDGASPRIIYGDLDYFEGWYIPNHRTFWQSVPEGISDASMDAILGNLQDQMQFTGIVEIFKGLFRPHLQSGDVAIVTGGEEPRIAGVITEITHNFGRKGYETEFSVTSGGVISNPDNPSTVATKFVSRLGGANRQRRLLDYIESGGSNTLSGKSSTGDPGKIGPPGSDGSNGASAYQVWLSLGNTGSEADFIASLSSAAILIGSVQLWPTGTAPTGWALCDGQAISRMTYESLFALIGTTYGIGDGTTTFNLPTIADPATGVSFMIRIE